MYQIPVAFQFKVEIGGAGGEEAMFQEVGGLAGEVATEEIKEGGVNDLVYRVPVGIRHANLILKRGMFNTSTTAAWCRKAIEDFDFSPRDVKVTLLDENGTDLASWSFTKAFPVKWSVSDFKAQDNALVIESLELAYLTFRKN